MWPYVSLSLNRAEAASVSGVWPDSSSKWATEIESAQVSAILYFCGRTPKESSYQSRRVGGAGVRGRRLTTADVSCSSM